MLKRCAVLGLYFIITELYLRMTGFLAHVENIILFLICQLVFLFLIYIFSKKWKLFEIKKFRPTDWSVFILGFMAYCILLGVIVYIPVHSGTTDLIGKIDLYSPINFSYACIFAPLMEEMMSRGWIQRGVFGNSYLGLIVAATIFSIEHQPADVWSFLPYFLLGSLLGYVHKHSDNLTPSILLHITINTLTILQPFL